MMLKGGLVNERKGHGVVLQSQSRVLLCESQHVGIFVMKDCILRSGAPLVKAAYRYRNTRMKPAGVKPT